MAAPGPPSHAHPGTPAPAQLPGSGASAGLPAGSPARGEEAAGLWPMVAIAFVALVLAVLWKKNGGLRFFTRRSPPATGSSATAPPAAVPPALRQASGDMPDRRA